MSESNRRDFLKYTAATGMGFWVAGQLRAAPSRSANQKLQFACVGVGGKGDGDSTQVGNVGEVVAICDTNDKNLEQKAHQFPNAKKYNDFRKLFDEMGDKVDAVTVSTPDHCHALVAMMGIRNKKHVYCQKPLTHYVAEARALREAANKYGVCTQMGNQGTAADGLREGVEIIQSGGIGNVTEAHVWTNRPIWPQSPQITDRFMDPEEVPPHIHWDEWLGPAPFRPYHAGYEGFVWRGWWDYGTGALGDMGCHTANLVFMALKLQETYPTSVYAESAIVSPETYPSWATVNYEFPARGDMPPVKVTWYEGHKGKLHNWPPLELIEGEKVADSGSIMVGEKGVLYSPSDYGSSYTLLPKNKFKNYEKPPHKLPRNGGDDQGMKNEWAAAIHANDPKIALSNFNYSAKLTEFILLGNVAIRCGFRKLDWDGEKMQVTNFPEANQFISRKYRKGYSIEF